MFWWQTSTCEVQTDLFLLFVSLGDFSGQLLAYLSLGPIFIIVGFVTLIIFKRELHTVSPSLPSQLLHMTKVFSFVAWCSCIHTFFSLFKEQAWVRWSFCQRTAGDAYHLYQIKRLLSLCWLFCYSVLRFLNYLSKTIEGSVWGTKEWCCRVGTLPRSSRIIALVDSCKMGSVCRRWCL